MRFGIDFDENTLEKIVSVLNNFGQEAKIFEIEKECLKQGINSSDYLFLILQHLNIKGIIEANKGIVKFKEKINNEIVNELKEIVEKRVSSSTKLFFTPLEVSKFFQCPRRLWLEKIVLARQEKEKVGKVWDGEALHLAVKLTLENLGKKDENLVIEESVENAIKSFQGSIEIKKEEMIEIIKNLLEFLKKENFDLILPEKSILTIQHGLVGSIDIICFRDQEIIPIEVKHASYKGRIKKEHVLQSVGEALLLSNYFRTRIKEAYIFYSQTNSFVKIDVERNLKEFLKLIRFIKRMYSSSRIPPKSRLPNYRERVCKGCHVRPACDNIEMLRREFKI